VRQERHQTHFPYQLVYHLENCPFHLAYLLGNHAFQLACFQEIQAYHQVFQLAEVQIFLVLSSPVHLRPMHTQTGQIHGCNIISLHILNIDVLSETAET
jgi:hypothetical protein